MVGMYGALLDHVSSDNYNYFLKARGTATTSSSGFVTVYVGEALRHGALFVKLNNYFTIITRISPISGTFSVASFTLGNPINYVKATLEWYVYAPFNESTNNCSHGLSIYNSTGNLVFNTCEKGLAVKGKVKFSLLNPKTYYRSIPLIGASSFMYNIDDCLYTIRDDIIAPGVFYYKAVRVTSNSIELANIRAAENRDHMYAPGDWVYKYVGARTSDEYAMYALPP